MAIKTHREGFQAWFVSPVARGAFARFAIEREDDGFRVYDLDVAEERDFLTTEKSLDAAKDFCDDMLRNERRAKHESVGYEGYNRERYRRKATTLSTRRITRRIE